MEGTRDMNKFVEVKIDFIIAVLCFCSVLLVTACQPDLRMETEAQDDENVSVENDAETMIVGDESMPRCLEQYTFELILGGGDICRR